MSYLIRFMAMALQRFSCVSLLRVIAIHKPCISVLLAGKKETNICFIRFMSGGVQDMRHYPSSGLNVERPLQPLYLTKQYVVAVVAMVAACVPL